MHTLICDSLLTAQSDFASLLSFCVVSRCLCPIYRALSSNYRTHAQKKRSTLCKRIQCQQCLCLRQLEAHSMGEVRFGRLLNNPRVPTQGLAEFYQGPSELKSVSSVTVSASRSNNCSGPSKNRDCVWRVPSWSAERTLKN